ncbi:unnamed protein product [Chrysoparadoxa australica]
MGSQVSTGGDHHSQAGLGTNALSASSKPPSKTRERTKIPSHVTAHRLAADGLSRGGIAVQCSKKKLVSHLPAGVPPTATITALHLAVAMTTWNKVIEGTEVYRDHHAKALAETPDMKNSTPPKPISLFFDTFFQRLKGTTAPAVYEVFDVSMMKQSKALVESMSALLSLDLESEDLIPNLEEGVDTMCERGCRPEHYEALASTLLFSLERCLGPEEWTLERMFAWNDLYHWMMIIVVPRAILRNEKNDKEMAKQGLSASHRLSSRSPGLSGASPKHASLSLKSPASPGHSKSQTMTNRRKLKYGTTVKEEEASVSPTYTSPNSIASTSPNGRLGSISPVRMFKKSNMSHDLTAVLKQAISISDDHLTEKQPASDQAERDTSNQEIDLATSTPEESLLKEERPSPSECDESLAAHEDIHLDVLGSTLTSQMSFANTCDSSVNGSVMSARTKVVYESMSHDSESYGLPAGDLRIERARLSAEKKKAKRAVKQKKREDGLAEKIESIKLGTPLPPKPSTESRFSMKRLMGKKEAFVLTPGSIKQAIALAQLMSRSVQTKEHKQGMSKYKETFTEGEALGWMLSSGAAASEGDATSLLKLMLESAAIVKVGKAGKEREFTSDSLYRFGSVEDIDSQI